MPTLEEVLIEETFKDAVDVEHRVFYTLTHDKKFIVRRNSKLLSLIVAHLSKKNALSEKEVDEMLLNIIN